MTRESAAVGLPPRPFFYTLDQVATLLSLEQDRLAAQWIWFDGRSGGIHRKDKFKAINIAPLGDTPEWRISEVEFVRWCRNRGVRIHERYRTV